MSASPSPALVAFCLDARRGRDARRRRALVVLLLTSLGCARERDSGAGGPAPPPASAARPVAGPPPVAPSGASVLIPAGTLKAGMPCGGVPRIPQEELAGEPIALGEYSIDIYPFPNDPGQPPMVNVSRDEAQKHCESIGKRLCTELEWERACKGPTNATYEYGANFSAANCRYAGDNKMGARPACTSGFGVRDMHGLVWEWTSSAWGRGTSGDLATVRGGYGNLGSLQFRCANGQGRPPSTQAKDVGFRCCSGTKNAAEVRLLPHKASPLVAEPGVESRLVAAMLRAMPADHHAPPGAAAAFDRIWRWHPRDHEEMLLARWTARPADGGGEPYHEAAVFKVCAEVPLLVTRMTGPVERLGDPGVGADPQRVAFPVSTGASTGEVRLLYSYGAVKVDQPPWIKPGNALRREADAGVPDAAPEAAAPAAEARAASTAAVVPALPSADRPAVLAPSRKGTRPSPPRK